MWFKLVLALMLKYLNNLKFVLNEQLNKILKPNSFDYIIDINLKSFSPSNELYENMMNNFYRFLKIDGSILTSESGMKWTTQLNLVSNNFLQIGGNDNNILTIKDLENFAQKNNLIIEKIIESFGFFRKKNEIIYKLTK